MPRRPAGGADRPSLAVHGAVRPRRTIGFLAYDGAQLLSIAGPSEVFAVANRAFAERDRAPLPAPYSAVTLSRDGGEVETASGLRIGTAAFSSQPLDTLVVPGGAGIRAVMANEEILAWLREAAADARRIVAFGGGVFILARAGLLDGRRCVTHWRFEDDLVREYPDVDLARGELFVRDGALFTAAGGSASVDVALSLVEEDFGKPVATHVAHMMVLSRVRPAGQPQLAAELRAQLASGPRVASAAEWIVDNIEDCPSVAELARRFAMSERNFSRRFGREVGMSPHAFIEQTRLEAARRWLAGSEAPLETVARRAGFTNAEHMGQAFRRNLHVTPAAYRKAARESAGDSGA